MDGLHTHKKHKPPPTVQWFWIWSTVVWMGGKQRNCLLFYVNEQNEGFANLKPFKQRQGFYYDVFGAKPESATNFPFNLEPEPESAPFTVLNIKNSSDMLKTAETDRNKHVRNLCLLILR